MVVLLSSTFFSSTAASFFPRTPYPFPLYLITPTYHSVRTNCFTPFFVTLFLFLYGVVPFSYCVAGLYLFSVDRNELLDPSCSRALHLIAHRVCRVQGDETKARLGHNASHQRPAFDCDVLQFRERTRVRREVMCCQRNRLAIYFQPVNASLYLVY